MVDNLHFDQEFFDLFANLISDEEEVDLLHKILEGKNGEDIVKEYIKSLRKATNDQN